MTLLKRILLVGERGRFVLILLLIILAGFACHWPHLNTLVWSSDEGIHLSAAYLVNQGLEPYRQVSFSQGPLFLEVIRWPLQWWGGEGSPITSVRATMLVFGFLSIMATAFIGRELKNDWAGWGTAVLLLLLPSFFYFARAVMADGPAIALGMWSAWAAIRFFQRGERRWLVGSAILLGLSLATKFLTIYILGWIALLLLYRVIVIERPATWQIGTRRLVRDGLLFTLLAGGTLVLVYAWYDLPSLFNSVFGMRFAMREAFGAWLVNNSDEVAEFWAYHAPLVALAAYGLVTQGRAIHRVFLLGSWLLLLSASLRVQNPLYHQHLQLLLPLVALLAALGITTVIERFRATRQPNQPIFSGIVATVGLILIIWLGFFAEGSYNPSNRYTELSANGLREEQEPIVQYLQKFTAPTDCVVTDDLNLAFISRRFPPPMLIDLSNARLATDSISDDHLARVTMRAGCQVVAPLTDRIEEYSPGFAQWSADTFLGSWQGNDEMTFWLGQALAKPRVTLPLAATLGDQLLLLGTDLDVVQRDQTLYLSLYWQSLEPLTTDYKIFVHLRDSENNTIVNGDHFPYNNLLPTTEWPVDQAVKETIRLMLPTGEALENYRLFVGIYDPESQERLTVEDDESGENAIIIPVAWDLL